MAQFRPPVWTPTAMVSVFFGTSILLFESLSSDVLAMTAGDRVLLLGDLCVLIFYSIGAVCFWKGHQSGEKFTIGDVFNPIDLAAICFETIITTITLLLAYRTVLQVTVNWQSLSILTVLISIYLSGYIVMYRTHIPAAYRNTIKSFNR